MDGGTVLCANFAHTLTESETVVPTDVSGKPESLSDSLR